MWSWHFPMARSERWLKGTEQSMRPDRQKRGDSLKNSGPFSACVDIYLQMQPMDDHALLREYTETSSETAFAQLVERHIGFVYSTALRRVGNPSQAEEITQAVLIILARKARTLDTKTVLPSWLYHTTRLTANNLIRQEARRARRDQEAFMQTLTEGESEGAWANIAPLLERALDRLGSKDREAVLLRFFGNQSMKEIGHSCGTTENAAKKRVNRGLEKMRKFFSRSGVVLTAAAIAEAVSTRGVNAAPIGLAAKVATATYKGTVLSGSTSALVKTTLNAMAWQKLRLACGAGALLLATGAAILLGSRAASNPRPAAARMFYAEGISQHYLYDQQGHEVMGKGGAERIAFSFKGVGCQWAIRLVADTNLPGAITDLGCDGTNIYIFVPGAGGTHGVGDELKSYKNAASLWPGRVKAFDFHMVPLWWGYCSGCVLAEDGIMPGAELILDDSETNDFQPRLGPKKSQLHLPVDQVGEIRPEATLTNSGTVFVTKWSFTRYRTAVIKAAPNKVKEPIEKYEIALSKFGVELTSDPIIPRMTGSTEVQDYRFPRMKTYLTDHWLGMQAARQAK